MKKIVIMVVLILLCALSLLGVVRNAREDNVVKWRETIAEGESLTHTFVACDPNGQRFPGNYLVITAEDMPAGMTLSESYPICVGGACEPPEAICDANCIVFSADLAWAPSYSQAGNYLFLIHCEDAAGNEDNKWFEVIVVEVDIEPPFLVD